MATPRGGGAGGSGHGTKRKRGDRTHSGDGGEDGGNRPSPHRPASLDMAQNPQRAGSSGPASPAATGRGGGRRGSGGRGGRGGGRGGGSGSDGSNLRRGNSENTNPGRVQTRAGSTSTQSNSTPAPSRTPASSTAAVPTTASNTTAAPKFVQPTAPAAQQNRAEDSDEEPDPEIMPYDYALLTDEIVENWEETGRSKVVKIGLKAVEAKDNVALGMLYQEIIRAALDLRLVAVKGGAAVKEIAELPGADDGPLHWINASSCFLDNVSCTPGGFHGKREHKALTELLVATGISPQTMRKELDIELLEELGLVRDKFYDQRTRVQTQLLYRQHNYNLLREESEGYSKLITEMFTTSGSVPPNAKEIKKSYDHVMSMIGTFDLDVGRVLDITLDAFAAMLVRNYRFFVKFLRISTWWPDRHHIDFLSGESFSFPALPKWARPESDGFDALPEDEKTKWLEEREERDRRFWDQVRTSGPKAFFLLGGPRADLEKLEALPPAERPPKTVAKGPQKQEEEPAWDDTIRRAWARTTGLAPPQGNWVAAQVLGFKLHFYASEARAPTDDLPANLIYLTALLIKIGFISLLDLYPHLWPDDSAMKDVKQLKLKERQEREIQQRPGGGKLNALAMAGALADEPVPGAPASRLREADPKRSVSAKPEEKPGKAELEKGDADKMDVDESTEELPEPADQKVALLKSLLCIGALPEALFILGKFPWLLDAFPELPEYLHRILHHCLSKVYESIESVPRDLDIHESEQVPDLDQSGVAKGSLRTIDLPLSKTLRWPHPDKYDADVATDYRFYWDDWSNNIPVCQTVDDVFTLCGSLLNLSGVKIGQDPTLLAKLARIGRHSLATDTSEENRKRWVDLSKRIIVPALSLTRHNSGAIAEVWELIRQYSITTRYNIYAEWFTGQISRMDDMKSAFDLARAETRDVLKRISKTNVKPMARALSKVSTSSPGVVFSVALNQIESYNNLVEVIVECARYFTFLSYDVLTWTLVNSLGARGRNRVQADGMLRSKWLSALALFSGKVFKRYSVMNPSPILQYVAFQFRNGSTTDMIILEELVTSMAGIVSDASFNEAQTIAMAGGPLLQGQIMLQLLDRRHESALKTTSRRLMKALNEPGLAGPLLISMAQALQTCIYRVPEDEAFLKVLANLYDETRRVLVQYLDLLRTNFSIAEFNAAIPSLAELMSDYGLDPTFAFWISRPSVSAAIAQHDEKVAAERKEAQKEKETRGETPEVTMTDADENHAEPKPETPAANESEKPEGETVENSGQDSTAPEKVATKFESESSWHPVVKSFVDATAGHIPDEARAVLSPYFYFTFWQLSLEDVFVPMASYDEENGRLKRKLMTVNSDRSDLTSRGKEKREEEKKSITDLQSRLQSEMTARIAAYQKTRQRINKEKDLWFANCQGKWDELNVTIIEQCILPRIRLSSIDALYTFKFLKHLHSAGTLNFRTVGLFDQFFNKDRMSAMFFICTAQEAENVGKFINELLKDLARWHAEKSTYEKEAWGNKKDLPGFKAKTGDKGTSERMDYESFRRILGKWHGNLHSALKMCFSGGEYMHIRNAINILKAMAVNFPVINWQGQQELELITKLSRNESREDLKLAAMSLLASLKRREKQWVIPQAFQLSTAKPNGAKVAAPGTPELGGQSALSAKAPEFKPRTSPSVNGTPKEAAKPSPIATDKIEVEDGEVNSAGLPPRDDTPAGENRDDQKAGAKRDEKPSEASVATTKETRAGPKRDKSPAPPVTSRASAAASKPDTRPSNLPPMPQKPTSNGRGGHGLPQRPETGPPRPQDRRGPPNDRHHHPDGRDAHHADRHDARAEYARHERDRLSYGWGEEKGPLRHGDERYEYDQGPGRDSRPSLRSERNDRHQRDRGAFDHDSGRQPREPGPPVSMKSGNPARSDRRGAGNAPPDDERAPPPYLDRIADVQRSESHGRPGSQRGSRAASPSRRDDRLPRPDRQLREEPHPPDSRRPPLEDGYRPRYDDGRGPGGPRSERPSEPSNPQSERLRESFPSGSGPHGYESRGRGAHEDRPPQESRYGRLNADSPPSAAPSRGGPSGNSRKPPANVPVSTPSDIQQPSADQDRPAPSGPSGGRPQTRSGGAHNRAGQSGGPPPSAPASDASAVHPDRQYNIDTATPTSGGPSSQIPSPTDTRGSGPPPLQGNERRGGDKRFAGVNTILQGKHAPSNPPERGQGPGIRGRGGRGGGGPPHSSTPSGPQLRDAPRDSHRDKGDAPPRPEEARELFGNRGGANSGPPPSRDDQGGGRNTMRDSERRPPRPRDGRSTSPRREGPPARGGRGGHDSRGGGNHSDSRPIRGREHEPPYPPPPPSNRRGGPGNGGPDSEGPRELRPRGGPGGPLAPPDREARRGPPGPRDGDDRRGGPGGGAGGGGPMAGGMRDSKWAARGPPPRDEGYGPGRERETRGRGGGGGDMEGGGSGRKRGRPPMDEGGYADGGKRRRGQH